MLDRDLAQLYGVTTGNLNKTVKRNLERFPNDFMFQLTQEETYFLIFQIGRPNEDVVAVVFYHMYLLNKALRCFPAFLNPKEVSKSISRLCESLLN